MANGNKNAAELPGEPTKPLQMTLCRVILIALLHFGLFEVTQQFAVHWRESTDELCTMGLSVCTFIALVWAAWPALAGINVRPFQLLGSLLAAAGLMALLHTAGYYYFWHLRPNLGLYREPDWVQQHPGFQREMQKRMRANLWRGESGKDERGAK